MKSLKIKTLCSENESITNNNQLGVGGAEKVAIDLSNILYNASVDVTFGSVVKQSDIL